MPRSFFYLFGKGRAQLPCGRKLSKSEMGGWSVIREELDRDCCEGEVPKEDFSLNLLIFQRMVPVYSNHCLTINNPL